MEAFNTIHIDRKQGHTQSPAALIEFCTGTIFGAGESLQIGGFPFGQESLPPAITVIYKNDSESLKEWASQFLRIRNLKQGWNGYKAPAPSLIARTWAEQFTELLLKENYEPGRLAPSAVGGVGITKRQLDRIVYVEFYNDGRILALFSDDSVDSEPVIKRVEAGYENFKSLIQEMRAYLDG